MPNCAPCNNRYFATREALEQHRENSSKHNSYCETCSRHFVDERALEQHLENSPVHSPYCGECSRSFRNHNALQQHLENSPVHTTYCKDCSRHFGSSQALQQHLDSPRHSYQPTRRTQNRSRSGSAYSTPTSSVYRLTYPWSYSPSPITYPETPSSATTTVPVSTLTTTTAPEVSSPSPSPKPIPLSPPASVPQLHVHIPSMPNIVRRTESVASQLESESESECDPEPSSAEGQSELDDEVPELRQQRKVPLCDVVLPSDISTPITPLISSSKSATFGLSSSGGSGGLLTDAILPTDLSSPITPAAISTLQRAMDNSSPTPTSATSATLVPHFGVHVVDKEVHEEHVDAVERDQDGAQDEQEEQQEREQGGEENPAEEEERREVKFIVNGEDVVLQSDISSPVRRGREGGLSVDEEDDRHDALSVDEDNIADSQITIRPSRIPTMHSPDPSPAPSSRASPIPSTSRSPPPRPPRSHLRASAASPSPSFSLSQDHDAEASHLCDSVQGQVNPSPNANPLYTNSRVRTEDPPSNVTSPDMRFEELQGLPRFSGGANADDDDDTSPLASQFEQDIRRYSTPLLEAEELGSEHSGCGRERRGEEVYGDDEGVEKHEEEYKFEHDHEFGFDEDHRDGEREAETGSPHIALPFLSQDPYLLSHLSAPYTTPLARRRPTSIHSSSTSETSQPRARPTQSQSHYNRNARIVDDQAYVCDMGDGGDDEFVVGRDEEVVGEPEMREVSFYSRFAPPERHARVEDEWEDERYRYDHEGQQYEYEYDDEYDEEEEIPFIASGIQVGPGHNEDDDSESSTPMLLTLCSRGPSFFRYPYPFQLSLPPIPEREHMEEYEDADIVEDNEDEGGASIHTMNSDDEREMASAGVLRSGGVFVRMDEVGKREDGGEDPGESPVTELALPSPPHMQVQLSEGVEDDVSDGEESVACPSPPNLSPLQSPRLDELARAICNELSAQDPDAVADENADVESLDLDLARTSPSLVLDANDDMDIMRINVDDAIDYYEDNVVEEEGDPFTDLARISLSILSETEDTYGYSYSYANSPVGTPVIETVKNAESSSTADEFFSARDSLVDTTPLAGMMDDDQPIDANETMIAERVSKALSELKLTETVSPDLTRSLSWVDYPELPPSRRSSSRGSARDSLSGSSSARSSPSLKATRSIHTASTQPQPQSHSRSNSSRSVSPQAFLLSLGMYENNNSGRSTPEVASVPARSARRETMQDFLDLESANPSPHMCPLPIDSDSDEPAEHVERSRTPHIQTDALTDKNNSSSAPTNTNNIASPSNASPCSAYTQQTPISVRTSYLQDHSGIPTPADIPSEENSLNWTSAKTLREACLKRAAAEEHARASPGEVIVNATGAPPKIVAPVLCERTESLPIPTSAADTDCLKDEPSIIGSIPSSPLIAATEVRTKPAKDNIEQPSNQATAQSALMQSNDKPLPANASTSNEDSTSAQTEAKAEDEHSLPASRQATSVMHCRICRADPCIETTATFCGHIFCYDCITREVIANSKCPVCRTPTLLYCLFKLDLSC